MSNEMARKMQACKTRCTLTCKILEWVRERGNVLIAKGIEIVHLL